MFERHDWTLFRQLSTLGQRAGVPVSKIAAVVAKELADNALDVASSGVCRAGLFSPNGIYVDDDGPGIDGDDDQVASLFSISRPLTSSKLTRMPTRGALGNGLRVIAGAVLASGGSLVVSTRGRTLRLIPQDESGETRAEWICKYESPGTRIEVQFGPALPVSPDTLKWVERAFALSNGKSTYNGKTSAYWYESDSFYELLKAAKGQTIAGVIGNFDGCGHPKSGAIAREFPISLATDLTRADADRLLLLARQHSKPVKHSRLGCVGPLVRGFPPYYAKTAANWPIGPARGSVSATVPLVMEAWAEFADTASFEVSVNRTPIAAEFEAYHNTKEKTLEVFGCGLANGFDVGRKPMRVCLNIDIPCMPIANDGKTPDLIPFRSGISKTIGMAVKRAKAKSRRGNSADAVDTQKSVILDSLEEAVAKTGQNGTYRFSIRQLFYAVRPFFLKIFSKEPNYDYFSTVIGDHETATGQDIPGIYRDARGTLYHPHTGETIPLGTLNVERYSRPAWTFNKVLYSEKEGFFEMLKSVNWPERHDCALVTSKGFASRAARDVLDLLGETGEELTFYAIHDADGPGTGIYQALQQATKARPGRKVTVVNLGLEPSEAMAMELQVEKVERKGSKAVPVADYVDPEWVKWLQDNRVELNAMTTPQFLAWLDAKFADLPGKVVPPAPVLAAQLENDLRQILRREIANQILQEANIDGLVDAAFAERKSRVDRIAESLPGVVAHELQVEPTEPWGDPVLRLAEQIAAERVARS
jgi:hypothetical protein